ncbi:MAG: hemolysin III family protein [Treponema sp.]|nr:hemolysin III family protein [Treponema sp.]
MSSIKKPPIAAVLPFYSTGEEIANTVLHGIGTLGAIAGLVLLNLKTTGIFGGQKTSTLDNIAAILFSATMIGMFLISTLYHAVQHKSVKPILRKLDHSVIFIFIAGTYTPFCLIGLGGLWGWGIFLLEWIMALLGIILNILDSKALKKIEMAAFILMGWAIVVGSVPLFRSISSHSIILLFAGGIAYTAGTFWYRKKTLKYNHAIWHGLVLAGTVCHWFSIWYII